MTKVGQKINSTSADKKELSLDRVTADIPSSLKKAFKAKAAAEGLTIKEVLRALIERYVEGKISI